MTLQLVGPLLRTVCCLFASGRLAFSCAGADRGSGRVDPSTSPRRSLPSFCTGHCSPSSSTFALGLDRLSDPPPAPLSQSLVTRRLALPLSDQRKPTFSNNLASTSCTNTTAITTTRSTAPPAVHRPVEPVAHAPSSPLAPQPRPAQPSAPPRTPAHLDRPPTMVNVCPPGVWSYYAYDPMRSMTYVALALFAVIFIAQVALTIKYRTRYMIPFVIGMLGESCGYIFRRVSADNSCGRGSALTWYLLQELFLILCPALMCASYYSCFGRIITFVGEKWTPIPSKWVTFTFVTVDIVSFVVQGAGGSLFSSDNVNLYTTAKAILLVGFIIQIIGLGLFACFAIIYHVRARRAGVPKGDWTKCLFTLYAGSVCVLVRGIFRCVEFGTGNGGDDKGYLLSTEGFFYGLEFGPILLAGLILTASYPGKYIPHARVHMFPPSAEEEAAAARIESQEHSEKESRGDEKRRWWRRS